jgi:hypothetical protein
VDKETEGRREREGIKRERAKERENIGRKNSAGTGSERDIYIYIERERESERERWRGGRKRESPCVCFDKQRGVCFCELGLISSIFFSLGFSLVPKAGILNRSAWVQNDMIFENIFAEIRSFYSHQR